MPEITREEAKQAITEWIEHHVFARDAFTGHEKFHDRYEAILRLALAALEDAERVEWIEGQIETGRGVTLYHGLGYGELEHQNGCEIAPTVRAAIDRARGVTPPADPPAPARA